MTLKEICEVMKKNRRGINSTGKRGRSGNSKLIHPIMETQHDVTIRFEWADPFAGWTGRTMLTDFSWEQIIPSMMEAERNMYGGIEPMYVKDMVEHMYCPMVMYDQRTNTMTMFFTEDPELSSKIIHHTMLDDDIVFMNGFTRIDNLKEAYVAKVITHKTSLNTGRMRRFRIEEGETRDQFLSRIHDEINNKRSRHMFTEVVYNKRGKPTLYFWTSRMFTITETIPETLTKIEGYIDTDVASARKAEITQLMLNAKFLGADTCTKVMDFLFNAAKSALPEGKIGGVSDGYHTFDELYHHRAILFATLCNLFPDYAWKSKQHDDPDFPMYDGMFICGINTPDGQATYHYDIDPYWDMFNVPEIPRAPKFDGHTPAMAIERIRSLDKLRR